MVSIAEETLERLNNGSLRVGFIGAGNMAQAIIGALIANGIVPAGHISASAPSDTHLAPLREQGIQTTHDNDEVLMNSDVVFLCVKPHIFADMTHLGKTLIHKPSLFISVMTAHWLGYLKLKLKSLSHGFLSKTSIVRCMPNTPSLVCEGTCVYAAEDGMPAALKEVTTKLLQCLGLVREIPERLINAAAAVAGSGPAYFYTAIEAMADGGVKMGLPRELAMALAAQTVRGAATMVQRTGRHPGQLKDEVCSPGGTTIAAMHALEKHGFRNSLISAVEAATLRADEIGNQNKHEGLYLWM